MASNNGAGLHSPLGLLAELTHRCPLGCPYCSNPIALEPRTDELDTQTWARVFAEAAGLGVLQVHLSGGEPGARRDLVEIMAAAHAAGLYTNLITSAIGITVPTLQRLAEAGLDHVQISIQDSERASADHIAGYAGAFARKRALAAEVVALKIPLTVNAVMHRANIDRIGEMVTLALALGASRVEIAHVQYYGWALKNRAALMPSAEQVARAAAAVEELRKKHHGQIVIDAVVPDYYAQAAEALRRRLGTPLAQRHAGRQGAPLPCRRVHSRTGILVGARALARRYLGQFTGVQRLPRHRLDAGAVPQLRAPRHRFRRLPLPGLRADRRRTRDRSGLPSFAPAPGGRRARRRTARPSLRLPAHVTGDAPICAFASGSHRAKLAA